jgi:hypothetical protein
MTVDLTPTSDQPLTPAEARALTDRAVGMARDLWQDLCRLYTGRAWSALGYGSWDDYCSAELRGGIALPREDRPTVVRSLRDAGLSIRAIASATGADRNTVREDLKPQVGEFHPVHPPAEIIGVNGKRYQPPPERSPLTVKDWVEQDEPGFFEAMAWRKAFRRASSRWLSFFAEWDPVKVVEKFATDDDVEYLDHIQSLEDSAARWFSRLRAARSSNHPAGSGLRVVGGRR